MDPVSEYPEGAPCWPELTTLVPEQAKDFYGTLLEWSFEDFPFQTAEGENVYTVCKLGGRRVAGLMTPTHERKTLPALWNTYLASQNVDEVVRRIEPRGGKLLMPPTEIPRFGRMAFALDPSGAPFGIWQARGHKGSELYADLHTMCWSEITTFDGPRIDAFYNALFSYSQQYLEDDSGRTMWVGGNRAVCSRRELTRTWSHLPSQWLTYFVVSNCDAAAETIVKHGGRIHREPQPGPHGRGAIATDPGGAWFGICEHSAAYYRA